MSNKIILVLIPTKKAPPSLSTSGAFEKNVLAATYFPTDNSAVSSAMEGLTAVFGMGTGVPPPPWLPGQSSRAGAGRSDICLQSHRYRPGIYSQIGEGQKRG